MQNRKNEKKRKNEEPQFGIKKQKLHNEKISFEELRTLCVAAVHFTKSLLGHGAENNWEDIQTSEGRSMDAGKYRTQWQYISSKDQLNNFNSSLSLSECQKDENNNKSFYFFNPSYENSKHNNNHIARKAACAVLTHSGRCDEHAYVVSMLLRMILPIGTSISLCSMRDKKTGNDFEHTFVIVGDICLETEGSSKTEKLNIQKNNELIVVDAWTIIGGATKFKDFWLRKNSNKYYLNVDCTFPADGCDHLIKRVRQQKDRLQLVSVNSQEFTFQQTGSASYHHDLKDQHNVCQHIQKVPLDGYDKDPSIWNNKTFSDSYVKPERTAIVMYELLTKYPMLKNLLIASDRELEGVPNRIGSGM